MICKNTKQLGFSTLELMIALMIMTLAFTAVILVTFSNQSTAVASQTSDEAIVKAQEQLEKMRALSRQDITLVQNCDDSTATKCSGVIDPYYTRKVLVTDIDTYTKKVTSQVFWAIGSGPQKNVELSTIVADWRSSSGGDTCSPTLTGDWRNPQLLGDADFGQSNGATDIDVLNKKAYATADASAANKDDFIILDVSDPTKHGLPILGSVNTGPGLNAVHVAGRFAYVANTSTTGQLQIINIDPNDRNYLKFTTFKVPGNTGTAVGNSVFYKNSKVYLGLTKTPTGGAPEFAVIDVSNPASPVYLGGYKTNTQVNAILINGNRAYVGSPQPTPSTPEKENLSILDITNPAAITRIGTFTAADPATQDGSSMYLVGSTLYFGRTVGGVNKVANHELFALNITNPAGIITLGSHDIASTVNAITVRSNLAFLVTSDPNLGFQIWDISNPVAMTLYASLNIQQTSTGGMDCDGNIMYIAQRSQKALQIVGPN